MTVTIGGIAMGSRDEMRDEDMNSRGDTDGHWLMVMCVSVMVMVVVMVVVMVMGYR